MRFTIRDVLWLTVVAALAVAFCVERSQRVAATREIQKARMEMKLKEGEVAYFEAMQDAGQPGSVR